MGNAIRASQRAVFPHMDKNKLRKLMLADQLSDPTADMAEALLFLQGQTLQMRELGERHERGEPELVFGSLGSRPFFLLATSYCMLCELKCTGEAVHGAGLSSGRDPSCAADFIAAFADAMQSPQDLLHDLTSLRAQALEGEKFERLAPIALDSEAHPDVFCGPFGEVLRHLAFFVRGAVRCAEIYGEIREAGLRGKLDAGMAHALIEGTESDQRRMIGAMGGSGAQIPYSMSGLEVEATAAPVDAEAPLLESVAQVPCK